jgi:hypothetical protein
VNRLETKAAGLIERNGTNARAAAAHSRRRRWFKREKDSCGEAHQAAACLLSSSNDPNRRRFRGVVLVESALKRPFITARAHGRDVREWRLWCRIRGSTW